MEDDFNEEEMFSPQAIKPKPKKAPVNPLEKYYRVTGKFVKLPSGGRYFSEGEYEATETGDIEILPMKAADELLLQSPEALMSGYALENLILSCVPAVKNPKKITSPDLDVILMSVRAVTYGDNMDVEAKCPSCGHEHAFQCNIPTLLQTMVPIPEVNEVRMEDDLLAYVRPYDLTVLTKLALATYNATRTLQAFQINHEEDETEATNNEFLELRNTTFKTINDRNIETYADCIINIKAGAENVTDREFIADFIKNASKKYIQKIEDKMLELNSCGVDKKLPVTCTECKHEWKAEINFDPSSFFANGS